MPSYSFGDYTRRQEAHSDLADAVFTVKRTLADSKATEEQLMNVRKLCDVYGTEIGSNLQPPLAPLLIHTEFVLDKDSPVAFALLPIALKAFRNQTDYSVDTVEAVGSVLGCSAVYCTNQPDRLTTLSQSLSTSDFQTLQELRVLHTAREPVGFSTISLSACILLLPFVDSAIEVPYYTVGDVALDTIYIFGKLDSKQDDPKFGVAAKLFEAFWAVVGRFDEAHLDHWLSRPPLSVHKDRPTSTFGAERAGEALKVSIEMRAKLLKSCCRPTWNFQAQLLASYFKVANPDEKKILRDSLVVGELAGKEEPLSTWVPRALQVLQHALDSKGLADGARKIIFEAAARKLERLDDLSGIGLFCNRVTQMLQTRLPTSKLSAIPKIKEALVPKYVDHGQHLPSAFTVDSAVFSMGKFLTANRSNRLPVELEEIEALSDAIAWGRLPAISTASHFELGDPCVFASNIYLASKAHLDPANSLYANLAWEATELILDKKDPTADDLKALEKLAECLSKLIALASNPDAAGMIPKLTSSCLNPTGEPIAPIEQLSLNALGNDKHWGDPIVHLRNLFQTLAVTYLEFLLPKNHPPEASLKHLDSQLARQYGEGSKDLVLLVHTMANRNRTLALSAILELARQGRSCSWLGMGLSFAFSGDEDRLVPYLKLSDASQRGVCAYAFFCNFYNDDFVDDVIVQARRWANAWIGRTEIDKTLLAQYGQKVEDLVTVFRILADESDAGCMASLLYWLPSLGKKMERLRFAESTTPAI